MPVVMLDSHGGNSGEDIFNTESEHETDLLPAVNLKTPGQVPCYNSFPYLVFTSHVIPFGTSSYKTCPESFA